MDREYVLIVAEGCLGCEAAKRAVAGRARIMDVTKSREAASIVQSLKLNYVPVLVELDHANGRACVMREKGAFCADLPASPPL